jgi:hypothetical protein
MKNRNTLLLIGAGVSLTLGCLTNTLQAQQPNDPYPPIQLPPNFPNIPLPNPPYYPPPPPAPKPPFWVEFLEENPELAAPLVAAVLFVPIWIVVMFVRCLLGLGSGSDSSRSPRREGVKDKRGVSPPGGSPGVR